MMSMMMKLAAPGENHKLLEAHVGTWAYSVKWWMSPDAPPSESKGSTVSKAVMGGRYVVSEHTGKMSSPGPDGKMMNMEFKGMAIEGYDNVKKRFVSSWNDNMGTGIMNSEGTYDANSKTFTYTADYEPMPGMKTKMRRVIKIADKDHHSMEFFEDRGRKSSPTSVRSTSERSPMILRIGSGSLRTSVGMAMIWWSFARRGFCRRSTTSIS